MASDIQNQIQEIARTNVGFLSGYKSKKFSTTYLWCLVCLWIACEIGPTSLTHAVVVIGFCVPVLVAYLLGQSAVEHASAEAASSLTATKTVTESLRKSPSS